MMTSQTNPMTWQAFKSTLEASPNFEYQQGQKVDASFHITEIKQASIVSVDCGGQMNSWTEVIVQLWEPPVKEAERPMTVSKALQIVNLVEKIPAAEKLALEIVAEGSTCKPGSGCC